MEFNQLFFIIIFILISAVIISFFIIKGTASEENLLNFFAGNTGSNKDVSLELGHKALHVKVDHYDAKNPKVYEFHMTDQGIYGNKHMVSSDGKYFAIRNWDKNKCNIFVTKPTGDWSHHNFIYYINPGAIIDLACGSLDNCLKGRVSSSACDGSLCDNTVSGWKESDQPNEFSVCGGCFSKLQTYSAITEGVFKQPFGTGADYCNEYTTGCPSESSGGCCQLVKDAPNIYSLKYGLFCGYGQLTESGREYSAKWFACADETESKVVFTNPTGENGFQYKCENRKWVPTADQGIDLESVQIKYDSSWGDEYTALKFYLANHNKASIKDVSIKAKITNSDINCEGITDMTTADCIELTIDKTKDSGWADISIGKLFNSEGLKCPGTVVADEDFCLNAKAFDVEVKYKYSGKDETDNFKITCNPPSANTDGTWHNNCIAEKK